MYCFVFFLFVFFLFVLTFSISFFVNLSRLLSLCIYSFFIHQNSHPRFIYFFFCIYPSFILFSLSFYFPYFFIHLSIAFKPFLFPSFFFVHSCIDLSSFLSILSFSFSLYWFHTFPSFFLLFIHLPVYCFFFLVGASSWCNG